MQGCFCVLEYYKDQPLNADNEYPKPAAERGKNSGEEKYFRQSSHGNRIKRDRAKSYGRPKFRRRPLSGCRSKALQLSYGKTPLLVSRFILQVG